MTETEVNSSMLSGKEVKVFRSIDEIGKSTMDSISDDPFFTYGWFKTLETQQTYKYSPIYVAVYDESKLVCVAPFFIESIEPNSNGLFSRLLNLVFRQNKALSCYSPRCYRSKILFADNRDKKIFFSLLSKEIDSICKKQKILKSQFPYVSEFDKLLSENIQNYGYQKMPGITTLHLDIQWTSFEDYLKSLKPKARGTARREIKKCGENGVTIEESELEDLTTKLSDLYANLSLKYNNNKSANRIFDSYFFSMLHMYAKEKTKLFIAKKNGEIVGFSLSLRQRDVLDVFMVGFNYSTQTKTDFSYFNLAYYAPIKWGIENDVKKIYYRLTMEKIKLDRGCKPEKTYCFVKYHNRMLRTLYENALKNPAFNYLRSRLGKLSF
jgi:predicted N-acyltransferase